MSDDDAVSSSPSAAVRHRELSSWRWACRATREGSDEALLAIDEYRS